MGKGRVFMEKASRNWKLLGALFVGIVFAVLFTLHFTAVPVKAAGQTEGFKKVGNQTYYVEKDGSYHKGWLTLNVDGNSYKYYFNKTSGVMYTGWVSDGTNLRYFSKSSAKPHMYGRMATGWITANGQKRYFFPDTGVMAKGWNTFGMGKRYFNKSTGYMYTEWVGDGNGGKRYFHPTTGVLYTGWNTFGLGTRYFNKTSGLMYTGWIKGGDEWRYFNKSTGVVYTGWVKASDGKRYFDPDNKGSLVTGWFKDASGNQYYLDPENMGRAMTGTVKIDDKTYYFDSNGVLVQDGNEANLTAPSSARTIKNYLLNALMPVGNTMYVWGGGWAEPTGNYKGLYPKWKQFYDQCGSGYEHDYDLSTSGRSRGLDCSGFVGWATYNVMHTQSGLNYLYASDASSQASTFASRGWGVLRTQSTLKQNNYKGQFFAGDVGSKPGHAFLVLGQCDDGSLVIVHSTPPCVQIAGTPTPSGSYSSEAIVLAKKYMKKLAPGAVSKFGLGSQSTVQYINGSNIMHWSSNVLSDPDGYTSMTADEILADLFNEN